MILVFEFLECCPSRSLPVVPGSRCFLVLPSEIPWVSVVGVCLYLGLFVGIRSDAASFSLGSALRSLWQLFLTGLVVILTVYMYISLFIYLCICRYIFMYVSGYVDFCTLVYVT